ncbi:hypothetical protein [uncultured Endozoicomonas sp.]|uniref:hypothetical protein n=1 Tax=uncultured Endozoicomonas sp. TaxID=432652 RepID=UPI0026145F0C|nr:hypothetical protein [uncultured Endozoicomonas sp.]
METVIVATDLWVEPNPNSQEQKGYDPAGGHYPQANKAGNCPCDACPQRNRCRDEALACDVFEEYLKPWKAEQRGFAINFKRVPSQYRFKKCS